jgi:4'-phosphopantetheinyl transferase
MNVKLNRDEIHVWTASPEIALQQAAELERTLSTDEIDRARRFHFETDRRNFIGRRAILRAILADYLATTPSSLRFLYNDFGKPRLDGSPEARSLSFNQSRSRGLTLVAVTLDRDVGVDIEFVNDSVPTAELATSFFSTNEIATLQALPESLRLAGFFNCWSRKEAYIKARGMGLSIPLDSFDVSLNHGDAGTVVVNGNSSDWKIENLDIDPRFAAAVGAPGRDWKVTRRNWQASD